MERLYYYIQLSSAVIISLSIDHFGSVPYIYTHPQAGDSTWKLYEKKCNQLKNHDARGDEGRTTDKTRAAVKELYSRILVTIRSAETISKRIDELRDEELQPQIIELLQG